MDDRLKNDLEFYKKTLLEWNKTHNLSGAKNENELDSFIEDALYPLSFIAKPKNLLDIGTGAGFPGLILAMALRDTSVTLVEPLAKRASFLTYIKSKLALDNVKVIRDRVQNVEPFEYDMITSRAVMSTKKLLEISKNHRSSATTLLFYKGERVYEEVDENIKHKIIKTKNRHYLLIGENLDVI